MQLAPGSWRLATPVFVAAVPLTLLFAPLGVLTVALGVAVLWFHRDPPRPAGDGVVAPAEGTVSVIREEDDRLRVGIYMSALSVHVNRSPLPGTVRRVDHVPGANKPAFSKESDRNERVRLESDDWTLVLIAGWFARRIHPYVGTGEAIGRGDRIAHISFGSRADVLMPADVTRGDLTVDLDDEVQAGETIARR
ncbi:phosphatidylserine decarboxylase [Halosegnis rubeus]|uniref:Phosphatidylserine decarboxylase n=1 Tax=Halosegnis rubeus TaxID=2212850 RepID=A0A5N5UAF4_9EURY|nr:protein sorting system archaetidylserine decarboxylase [Halosegnis rubeus]KAB7512657.1 phosphatidylserine decarboxylase [Halosegnis rubeus]KAB7515517.1 phosphatidylserine decarboxylase [Halosegnis rubeus]